MRRIFLLALLAACDAKKRKKKEPPLEACDACELLTKELQKVVKQRVRARFLRDEDAFTWLAALEQFCPAAPPRARAYCDAAFSERRDAVAATLDGIVASGTTVHGDAALELHALRRALCGFDGPVGACHRNRHFVSRSHAEAVDVAFRNDVGAPLDVFFLRHGADWDEPSSHERRHALEPGGWYRAHASQHWTYRFLAAQQDWDRGVDVTLGPAGERKFEAWAIEPRPGYVDVDRPRWVPAPGAVQPEGWDEEEDGAWEPPVIKNPDRNRTNTPNAKRRLGEEELEAPPFVATPVRSEL